MTEPLRSGYNRHRCNTLSLNHSLEMIAGYTNMVEQYIAAGWNPYLLTLTFRHIAGSKAHRIQRMKNEIERVYATLVTRIERKPTSFQAIGRLPIMLVCADLPAFKWRNRIQEVRVNEGLHFHAILLVPPHSRLKYPADRHFRDCAHLYLTPTLTQLHAEPITDRHGNVVDYVFKSLKDKGLTYDDSVIILPKSNSEVRASGGRGVASNRPVDRVSPYLQVSAVDGIDHPVSQRVARDDAVDPTLGACREDVHISRIVLQSDYIDARDRTTRGNIRKALATGMLLPLKPSDDYWSVFGVALDQGEIEQRPIPIIRCGPRYRSLPGFRLEFNPSHFGDAGFRQLATVIKTLAPKIAHDFFGSSIVADLRLSFEIADLIPNGVIIASGRKRKYCARRDGAGRIVEVRLGVEKNETRACEVSRDGRMALRIERRLKPRCKGSELFDLPNPFSEVRIVAVDRLLRVAPGRDGTHPVTVARAHGLSQALASLPRRQRRNIESALRDAVDARYTSTEDAWQKAKSVLRTLGFWLNFRKSTLLPFFTE